ncbi:MAG: hypothetical protein ACK4RV_07485 [Caulobacter sp.]
MLTILTAMLALAAPVEDARDAIARAETEAKSTGRAPSMGYWLIGPDNGWTSVSISVSTELGAVGKPPRRAWTARRATSDGEKAVADSRACPALTQALGTFDDLPAAAPRLPGNRLLDGEARIVSSDTLYGLWSAGQRQPGGHFYSVRVEASSGPYADWVIAAETTLAPCWRPA